jgi:phosphoribosylformimino-5-aminoimidazole carboxamide ribotide isomerase
MELIPVIDIRKGMVIRGHAGQRQKYLPNSSVLIPSYDPLNTCRALNRNFRPHWIYVADLDGIEHNTPQYPLLEKLTQCGPDLAVDAGTRSIAEARKLIDLGVRRIVIGLETLPSLKLLDALVSELGPEHLTFSLDLYDGEPLGPEGAGKSPIDIVSQAIEKGIRQLIVLDLSHVGMHRGVPTGQLCHSIKNRWPDLVVWTGGGVRSLADLHKLSLDRVDGAMVASSLHDGHITPADWKSFEMFSGDVIQIAMDA